MKKIEYLGVILTMLAYMLVVTGWLEEGFELGIISQMLLGIYFYKIRSFATLGLQSFFVCANIYGLVNLGVL